MTTAPFDPEEVNALAKLFRSLGAPEKQSVIMARQLLKRAKQLAETRQMQRLEAVDHLVRVMISGRAGEVPPDATDHAPPKPPGN